MADEWRSERTADVVALDRADYVEEICPAGHGIKPSPKPKAGVDRLKAAVLLALRPLTGSDTTRNRCSTTPLASVPNAGVSQLVTGEANKLHAFIGQNGADASCEVCIGNEDIDLYFCYRE